MEELKPRMTSLQLMLPGKFEVTASIAGILVLNTVPVGSVKSDTL